MESYEPLEEKRNPPKRPVLLTVIGILTFINLGLYAFQLLGDLSHGRKTGSEMANLLEPSRDQIEIARQQGTVWLADQMEKYLQTVVNGNNAFGLQLFFNAAFIGLGLAGVILMFRRQRIGFHLYIISCMLRIGAFYAINPVADIPSLFVGYYVCTSLLFILLYSRCLSWANQ